MADFIVTNTNDSGAGSLRQALADAEANGVGADTITFDASLDGQEINLQSELVITQGTVSINGDVDGDGNPDVRISGDSNDDGMADAGDTNILTIDAAATVNLNSVHLTEGYARGADGGYFLGSSYSYSGDNASAGITNSGTLTITDSIISDNRAIGGDGYDSVSYNNGGNGGSAAAGILNNTGAVLSINETLFDNNIAYGGRGGNGYRSITDSGYTGGDGGSASSGIANFSLVNSNEILFNDGLAYGGNGGVGGYGYYGGGNGGDGGDTTLGILNGNTGTLTGDNTGAYLGTAVAGNGGPGGPGSPFPSDPGNPGSDGQGPLSTGTYTFVNQGGDVSGFTDTGFGPFYANGTIATAGDDALNIDGNETIIALAGNDTIIVANGISNVFAGAGNDIINLQSGDPTNIVGETFNGGTGDDTLIFVGGDHDFRDDTIFSIENLTFNDPGIGFPTDVFLNADQIGTGLASDANITFDQYSDTVETINIDMNGQTELDLTGLTFNGASTTTANINIIAGSAAENIIGSSITDIVDYSNSAAGVTVFTSGRSGRGGDAQGDQLTDIENITGSDQQDQIVLDAATTVDNTVNAGDGDDRIRERDGGTNVLNGEDGDDNIFGASGNDTLNGGNNEDSLFGNGGNDLLIGGDDDFRDVLFGGAGIDELSGGGGNDALRGNVGDDILNGGDGRDNLQGGNGADILNGDAGDDVLDGGNSSGDILNGGIGNDRLTGGIGNDIFIFEEGSGTDRIIDFNNGAGDQIDLTSFGLTDFDDVLALTTQFASDIRLNFSTGETLILNGLTIDDLDANDFILETMVM